MEDTVGNHCMLHPELRAMSHNQPALHHFSAAMLQLFHTCARAEPASLMSGRRCISYMVEHGRYKPAKAVFDMRVGLYIGFPTPDVVNALGCLAMGGL